MAVTEIGRAAWRALGGEDEAVDVVAEVSPPPALPSRLPAGALLADAWRW